MGEDSAVALETGATANLAYFRWLGNRNSLLEKRGFRRVSTFWACARYKFCDGRLGEVRFAAGNPVGLAGCRGTFAACALEADIPAVLRKGA